MGSWGWRPLVMGLVLSASTLGCAVENGAAPDRLPTITPQLTLTTARPTPIAPAAAEIAVLRPSPDYASPSPLVYAVQPSDSAVTIARQFGIAPLALQTANPGLDPFSPGALINIPAPTRAAPPLTDNLIVQPPTCYDTRSNQILCLGRVENPLAVDVERVAVQVRLLRPDGDSAMSQQTAIEQTIIPAGESAPYRVIFAAPWTAFAGIEVSLHSAEVSNWLDKRYVTLTIEEEQGRLLADRFVVTGRLYNPGPEPVEMLRAVVTLRNSADEVLGYRVILLNETILPVEGRWPVRVEILPQASDPAPRYTLYVESRTIRDNGG
ncbi:MAG: LysM peptidoglycan-binding domain-containing protein [Chloroflexi bacterium]|nr:LysM peptidoglycan-binding domain-containing protein [Chloroflexota bacterium]